MPPRSRVYFVGLIVAYTAHAVSSLAGSGPTWPNRISYAALAIVAGCATLAYVTTCSGVWRRLMVGAIIIASGTRALGYALASPLPWAFRVGAVGSHVAIISLALLVNTAGRRRGM